VHVRLLSIFDVYHQNPFCCIPARPTDISHELIHSVDIAITPEERERESERETAHREVIALRDIPFVRRRSEGR